MAGWERWSTGNFARNLNLTILQFGICTNQNLILENETHKIFYDFEIQTDHQFSPRRSDLVVINKIKKENLLNRRHYCPDRSHSENEKKIKRERITQNLPQNSKKEWNVKVKVISIIIVLLETTPKELIKGMEDFEVLGRTVTIQTKALLISARILSRVLQTWFVLRSLKLQQNNISKRWPEKITRNNNNNNNNPFYCTRKEGEGGLTNYEDYVDSAIHGV